MNIFVVVGIVTLSLLAIKPISNQVLAQTNETSTQQAGKCSSDLNIQAEVDASGENKIVYIHGALTCAGVGIGGAHVIVAFPANCGHHFQATTLTDENGGFPPGKIGMVVSPCTTPYRAEAHFAGDSANLPASVETVFYISENTSGGPTSNNTSVK